MEGRAKNCSGGGVGGRGGAPRGRGAGLVSGEVEWNGWEVAGWWGGGAGEGVGGGRVMEDGRGWGGGNDEGGERGEQVERWSGTVGKGKGGGEGGRGRGWWPSGFCCAAGVVGEKVVAEEDG